MRGPYDKNDLVMVLMMTIGQSFNVFVLNITGNECDRCVNRLPFFFAG